MSLHRSVSLIGIAVDAVRRRSFPHDKGQNSTTSLFRFRQGQESAQSGLWLDRY